MLGFSVLASQIEQHIFRDNAERLLKQIQSLQLQKTAWSETRKSLQPWAKNANVDDRCDEHACSVQINLEEVVFHFASTNTFFLRLDDYIRWKLKLSYTNGPFVLLEAVALRLYMGLGGRPAEVMVWASMVDGIVSGKSFVARTLFYPTGSGFLPIVAGPDSLWAAAETVPEISHDVSGWCERQFNLHPEYLICGPSGCEGCVAGWVNFTPRTNPADIQRLMDFNLSCLTRLHPCQTQLDIMPKAWAQYLAERPRDAGTAP